MNKMIYRTVNLAMAMLLVAMMILTGCTGTSKPSKFYLLLTLPDTEEPAQLKVDPAAPSVLIGPITLAAYLERNQIVRRAGKNEMTIDEFTRWGEPLQDNFYRVLIDNLSSLLNTSKTYAFNQGDTFSADFQVIIDVIRFDTAVNGDAYLTAFWNVFGEDGRTVLLNKKSVFQVQPSSSNVAGLIEAQNKVLTNFSREIAAAIQSLND